MSETDKGATLLLALYFPGADPEQVDPDTLADQVVDAINDSDHIDVTGVAVEVSGQPMPQWLQPGTIAAVRNLLSEPADDDELDDLAEMERGAGVMTVNPTADEVRAGLAAAGAARAEIERLVRQGKNRGLSVSEMARLARISRQTVYTILGTKEDDQ